MVHFYIWPITFCKPLVKLLFVAVLSYMIALEPMIQKLTEKAFPKLCIKWMLPKCNDTKNTCDNTGE